jgi:glyoxylate/hydroxypyruvate reductase
MTSRDILVASTGMTPSAWRDRLAALMPGRAVHLLGDAFDKASIGYAVTWYHPPGALRGLANLAAIFSLGAGVDHVFADPSLPDVPIARVVDPDLTQRMTEWVVLHVLLHHRRQRRYEARQRDRIWIEDRDQPAAKDVRVGVMGLGELGADAAAKLAGLGFQIAGWSTRPKELPRILSFAGDGERDAFLARTDILVVLLPHTPATHGIVNLDMLAKLARDGALGGPFLINAGRGGLQVEADILAALDAGILRGVSLDVFESEPLPASSRLWSHPAVYISPHIAALSDHDAISRLIATQIGRLEAGGRLEHVIDRRRRY